MRTRVPPSLNLSVKSVIPMHADCVPGRVHRVYREACTGWVYLRVYTGWHIPRWCIASLHTQVVYSLPVYPVLSLFLLFPDSRLFPDSLVYSRIPWFIPGSLG